MIRVSRILTVMAALELTAALVMAQSLRTGRTKSGIAYEPRPEDVDEGGRMA